MKKIRLGDLLVEQGLLSQEQLQQAIQKQAKTGGKLGNILIQQGYITEDKLLTVLSQQLNIPFVDIHYFEFKPELIQLVPEIIARRFRALVLNVTDKGYVVGLADPLDIHAYDELSRILKKPVELALIREVDAIRSIDLVYRKNSEISSLAEKISQDMDDTEFDISQLDMGSNAEEAPVAKLLQSLFQDAIQIGATDIHIEPEGDLLRIRQRIDGVLHEQIMTEKRAASALTQRLKLMAGLNIAERRLPQDGSFMLHVKGKSIDIRLSTLPTHYGESVVMRLLNQSQTHLDMALLGIPKNMLVQLNQLLKHPHGLILVTGPTGSGKTTTLYSMLKTLNQPETKIITVEDPVEYRLPRITQVQVNHKIGLDFARILRTTLRQDPDVLLIGEIRDAETANIALKAAMTGHLVLATLHTNDAITSAMRLIDLGTEGYLVATATRAVIAQRLMRKICEICQEPYAPNTQESVWIDVVSKNIKQDLSFVKGRGCNQCLYSGYRGRIGVYELLLPDAAMTQALRDNNPTAFVKAAKNSSTFIPLSQTALELAGQKLTTVSEALRVTGEISYDEA